MITYCVYYSTQNPNNAPFCVTGKGQDKQSVSLLIVLTLNVGSYKSHVNSELLQIRPEPST